MDHLQGFNDTIVAIATPPGTGAIAIIRLSGKEAINIAGQLFSKELQHVPSHTIHYGNIILNKEIIDEVLVSVFRSPASYTGEDVIEISCHGSPFIQEKIVEACLKQGARLAMAGEFTQRAFLNGKLDLTQAEAVADLIASDTAAAHKVAMQNMKGNFSQVLKALREQLIQFAALIELELDFSQEDVEFADRKKFYDLVQHIKKTVTELLQSFKWGNVIKNGVNTVIAGKPNAGKSTLLNALLNENRAIVSEIAGTTRDTIEEVLNIDGILFRLIDTAGLRHESTDRIEMIGISRTKEKIRQAGIVLYLFDVNNSATEEIEEALQLFRENEVPYLLIGNKIDEDMGQVYQKKWSKFSDIIFISAKTEQYLEQLKNELVKKVTGNLVPSENVIITNIRHYTNLQQILNSLNEIEKGLDDHLPGDLLALDIRTCLFYLGEITGTITTEDKLDYIFSKFCLGK